MRKTVNIEIAKLAKLCNFDWGTGHMFCEYTKTQDDPEYPEGGGPFSMEHGEIEFVESYNSNAYNQDTDYYNLYSAPHPYDLSEWLRNVKHIHIITYPILSYKNQIPVKTNQEDMEYTFHLYIQGVPMFISITDHLYKSFEDAEENGLKTALNYLIDNETK